MLTPEHTHTWEDAVRSLIEDPNQFATVEACYFDRPLSRAAARYAESLEWNAMREIIGSPCGIAVDVGAGNGIVSYALAKDGWTTIAVEPDASMLVGSGAIRALARETGVFIDVRDGLGEALPLNDGEASVVIARQVLHHARNLDAFACEVARVLERGGLLVSTRDHVVSGSKQMKSFLNNHPLHKKYGGEKAYSRTEYRNSLLRAGFIIEREIGPLDSVINYAPFTPDTLRREIARRFGPLDKLINLILSPELVFESALRFISSIDRRPGRLVSFICRKV